MIPTAALLFELPSMPAQGTGVPPMQDSPTGFARPDDSKGSFDSILHPNSPTVPAPGAGRSGSASPSHPLQEERQAALIEPAKFRDRVSMPSSLVSKASAETTEKALRPAGKSEVAAESSVEVSTAGAILEWVAAGNVPWPSMQPLPALIDANSCRPGTEPSVPSPTGQVTTANQPFPRPSPKTVPTSRDGAGESGPAVATRPSAAASQAIVVESMPPVLPSRAGSTENDAVPSAEPAGSGEVALASSAQLGNSPAASSTEKRSTLPDAPAPSSRAGWLPDAGSVEIPQDRRSLKPERDFQTLSTSDASAEDTRDTVKLAFPEGLVEVAEPEPSMGTAQPSSNARPARTQTRQAIHRSVDEDEPLKAVVEEKPSSVPTVFAREIVVSGRRFDAKSLGEYPVAGQGSGSGAEVVPAIAPEGVSPQSVASSFDGSMVPPVAFQSATGRQAAEILKSLFNPGIKAVADPRREPSSPSSRREDASGQPLIQVNTLGSSLLLDPGVLMQPEALLQVVEDRLKAEGIATAGPVSIRILKTPAPSEPGEFQVRAEGREVSLSGWWDTAGRMVALPPDQTRPELLTRSDGKNQPGNSTVAAVVTPGRSTTSAAIPIPVEGIGSPVNQKVSTVASPVAAGRFSTFSSGGISSARQALTMRSSNNQAEFAGSAGTRSLVGLGRAPESKPARPQDLLTELATMPFAEKFSRVEPQAANPGTPLERIVQSDRIDKMDAVERLRSVIQHEMAVLQASGGDSLAVVVRPTADSEIFIQLTRENGGVEAFVRMEKGDTAGLRLHWAQLEGALADQQVRLQPLQAASSTTDDPGFQDRRNQFSRQQEQQGGDQAGTKFSFDGQSRGGFRQDDPRRPHLPPDIEPLSPKAPAPSAPRSLPRRGGHNRNFDNWA